MAEANTDDNAATPRSLLARLAGAAWLIGAVGLLLAVLALAGVVSGTAALIILAGVAILAVAIPRATAPDRRAVPAEPAAPVWPETGLKLFAEALPDPCFIVDVKGVVRYANRRASEAFPIKAGDQLTFRLRVPDLVAAFDRVAKGGPPERVEFAERVPTERWFAAWFSRLDAGGRNGRFVALIIDDMTERRRSERIRVDFVANASHELRTPLASLAGFIETLQGPARDDPAARERFLKIMREQATRMSRLVDDLLSLSRIEMKAHVRPSDAIDLGALVRHVADALEPLARELGLVIVTSLPKGPVIVTGDRDELIQVLENLIENACKYGHAGEKVEVTVRAAAGEAGPEVSIADHGPGIAEEHLPRLTERFYRIDAAEGRQHRGTGLGLAIVKHILARHQARLAIASRLGEGSTFTVVFPQAASPADPSDGKNINTDQRLALS